MPEHSRSTELIDVSDWASLRPHYESLLARDPENVEQLEQLLLDRSEVDAALTQAFALAHVAGTSDTGDADAQARFKVVFEEIKPEAEKVASQLDRKIVESPYASTLDPERYGVLLRDLRADMETFREENTVLSAEDVSIEQEYNRHIGAMDVELGGERLTLQQAALIQEGTDRDRREEAWRACAARRLEDSEAIDELFDRQVALRERIGRNAGFDNYVDYIFARRHRFDYSPADCKAFHEAAQEHCVPILARLSQERSTALGIEKLEPWDMAVDPHGYAPLRPFADVAELVERTRRVYERLDPEIGADFASMAEGGRLDLGSRPGKAAGGYMVSLDVDRTSFIFMNAVGSDHDIQILLHEGGHAYHNTACAHEPLIHYRDTCAEISEFASMSMELLTLPYMDEFYPDEEERKRSRRKRFELIAGLLSHIAMGDSFMHFLYENPGHGRDERAARWSELRRSFRPVCDWSEHETYLGRDWQRIGHFFDDRLYFFEYAASQLGALQMWLQSRDDEARALENYKRALRLGGSKPLPELFRAAGCEFDFSSQTVGRLLEAVMAELE